MPSREAMAVWSKATRDPVDDVRLLAYAMKDDNEKKLTDHILALTEALPDAPVRMRNGYHKTIAGVMLGTGVSPSGARGRQAALAANGTASYGSWCWLPRALRPQPVTVPDMVDNGHCIRMRTAGYYMGGFYWIRAIWRHRGAPLPMRRPAEQMSRKSCRGLRK